MQCRPVTSIAGLPITLSMLDFFSTLVGARLILDTEEASAYLN